MKHSRSTLATLALTALALALFAGAASAAPPAPTNSNQNHVPVYQCYNSGDWKTLEFKLPTSGTLRRGIVYKNGDNRKADLALKNSVWEFTFVGDLQCKHLDVRRYGRFLIFKQCGDGIDRFCAR